MAKNFKFSSTANPKLQRKINTSIIFNYLRNNYPKSRAEISRDLKISAPAVSRAIDDLIDNGYVIETEKLKTKSGKRPILLEINLEEGYVLGIDLAKERIRTAVTNLYGKTLKIYQGCEITNTPEIGDKLINEIKNILRIDKKNSMFQGELKAISVGIPAQVDIESGKIYGALLYSNWKELNLKKLLKKEFKVPIFIDNVVHFSALGEKHHNGKEELDNFIFIEVSSGIGAGLIIENHLFRGSYGFAGEIGFSIIGRDNLEFKIANKGYLESHASVESIKKNAIKRIKGGAYSKILKLTGGDINKIEAKTVCSAAIDGDRLAKEIIRELVEFLAVALANLILILNPKMIIIGGGICILPQVHSLILEPIIKRIDNSIPFPLPDIRFSFLSEDAAVIGASIRAIDELLRDEFPFEIENK